MSQGDDHAKGPGVKLGTVSEPPSLGTEMSDPHTRQGSSASSVTTADGEPVETKKARYVVASSRVLRGDGVHRFAFRLPTFSGSLPNSSRPFRASHGRRFGLLSEAPPVGTQPQARAIIGQGVGRLIPCRIQAIFPDTGRKNRKGRGIMAGFGQIDVPCAIEGRKGRPIARIRLPPGFRAGSVRSAGRHAIRLLASRAFAYTAATTLIRRSA